MKKILVSMALVVMTMVSHSALAQMKYLKGRDYTVLENPLPLQKTGQKEVLEFFSYVCPHCASLHPDLMTWVEKKKPADVAFYPMPALGGSWTFVGRVKFTAEKLGLGKDFDQAYFDAIHKDGQRKYRGDKDAAFAMMAKFANVGVDQVEKAWDSLAVKNKMRRSAELWQQAAIQGVPALVVNGKYVVSLSATGAEHMLEVVDFLLATTQP